MPTTPIAWQFPPSAPAPAGTEDREAYQDVPPAAWYALRLRSNQEFRVAEGLERAGIAGFLPSWTHTVRWTDRTKTIVRPLFPCYIFARFVRLHEAGAVLAVSGVIQILGSNELSAVSDDEIANLRRVVESPAPVECGPYVAGSRVTVARGPFAGVTGVITRVRGAAALTIPVDILGRSVSVQIDAADVETAK